MRVRERNAGAQSAVVDSLRSASGSVRTAINGLSDVSTEREGAGVVEEAREQLVAAMHLIDGVGLALRRNGL
jgi:hypothetical protein